MAHVIVILRVGLLDVQYTVDCCQIGGYKIFKVRYFDSDDFLMNIRSHFMLHLAHYHFNSVCTSVHKYTCSQYLYMLNR